MYRGKQNPRFNLQILSMKNEELSSINKTCLNLFPAISVINTYANTTDLILYFRSIFSIHRNVENSAVFGEITKD